jgi:hypothetical protein
MAPPRIAAVVVAFAALVLPAQALAGSVNVNGTGQLTFQTGRGATAFATTIRNPARIKLITSAPASFRPVCIRVGRKPCVKWDRVHKQWKVLRAVKFYYSGSAFRLVVRAKNGFAVGITGVGGLNLNGAGTYTQDGVSNPYSGVVRLRLK